MPYISIKLLTTLWKYELLLMLTAGSMCIFQVPILTVPVEVTLQIQSQSNHTVCITFSSFTPIHSDGKQMQYASWDQWFPVLKGPCEIASPSYFQMLIPRFNWIRFWKHCLNIILFCSLGLCFSYLYEEGLLKPFCSEHRLLLPGTGVAPHPSCPWNLPEIFAAKLVINDLEM